MAKKSAVDNSVNKEELANGKYTFSVRPNGSRRMVFSTVGPSRSKQEFKDSTNVNNILKKYKATGVLEHVNKSQPIYGDFSEISDYQGAIETVRSAEDAFMGLPAAVRKHFNHSPQEFLLFAQDPRNAQVLIDNGLAKPLPPVPVVPNPGNETPPPGSPAIPPPRTT